jgi:cardiolipin synthase
MDRTDPARRFLPHNHVIMLTNGEEAYRSIKQALEQAQHSVRWANFYWEVGGVWEEIAALLMAASRRGVTVEVLADAYGTAAVPEAELQDLRRAGVSWRHYNRWNLSRFWRYNRRLHKKVLVIDDTIGFTGGVGVADFWAASTDRYPHAWQDAHFKVTGPVVAQMAESFRESWARVGGPVSRPPVIEQSVDSYGLPVVAINSPASGGRTAVAKLYTDLINQAQATLIVATPYFGPDRQIRAALAAAARRGVAVRLLINGPYNTHHIALQAGRHYYASLLRWGVQIYEYQPTSLHAKLVVVDARLSSVGSGNFNMRSFYHDDEFNLLSLKLRQAISSLGRYLF